MTDVELEEKIKKNGDTIEMDAGYFYDLLLDVSLIEQSFLAIGGLCEVKKKSEQAGKAVERACNRIESIVSNFTESQEREEE